MSFANSPAWRRGWRLGVLAGLWGGLAMGLYALAIYSATGQGPWYPINMVASVLPYFRPVVPDFDPAAVLVALPLHFATAACWGVAFAALMNRVLGRSAPRLVSRTLVAALVGPLWGLVTWLIMGLGIAPRLGFVPDLTDQTHYLAAHLVFGLTAAMIYVRQMRQRPMVATFLPDGAPVERVVPRR